MMTMLLIAGIAVLAAGLLAIVFGIPGKEFSFGNTLIVSGAGAACTRVGLLCLGVVVRELRNIARRLGPANVGASSAKAASALPVASAGEQSASATPNRAEPAAQPSPPASSAPPWQEEGTRDRGRGRDGAPEAATPEP